jgi:hypothetical protein
MPMGRTSVPNEKLTEGSRALDDGETDRLNIKLEEDTRNALMTNLSFIVCHAVLFVCKGSERGAM